MRTRWVSGNIVTRCDEVSVVFRPETSLKGKYYSVLVIVRNERQALGTWYVLKYDWYCTDAKKSYKDVKAMPY
jgi:hypothetical protein